MNEKVGALKGSLCRLTSMASTLSLSLPRPKHWASRRGECFHRLLQAIFLSVLICALFGTLIAAWADQSVDAQAFLPGAIGREVTADVVNLMFLFDRIGSKPPKVITRNYLDRVSQPSSPFLSGLPRVSRRENRSCAAGEPIAARSDAW